MTQYYFKIYFNCVGITRLLSDNYTEKRKRDKIRNFRRQKILHRVFQKCPKVDPKNDVLVLLVKLVKSTVMTVEIDEPVETVETAVTVGTALTEDLKKYDSLTHSVTDNLNTRDASASKNF